MHKTLISPMVIWYFISCSSEIHFNMWRPSFNWKIFICFNSKFFIQYCYSHKKRFNFLYLLLATETSVPLSFLCSMILITLLQDKFYNNLITQWLYSLELSLTENNYQKSAITFRQVSIFLSGQIYLELYSYKSYKYGSIYLDKVLSILSREEQK